VPFALGTYHCTWTLSEYRTSLAIRNEDENIEMMSRLIPAAREESARIQLPWPSLFLLKKF
jgi:hypothetical protein